MLYPPGRDVFAVVAAKAEFERGILRERVQAGLSRARERGVRLGRPLKLDASHVLRLQQDGLSVRVIARSVAAPSPAIPAPGPAEPQLAASSQAPLTA